MKVYFGQQMVVGRNRSVTVEKHDRVHEDWDSDRVFVVYFQRLVELEEKGDERNC